MVNFMLCIFTTVKKKKKVTFNDHELLMAHFDLWTVFYNFSGIC